MSRINCAGAGGVRSARARLLLLIAALALAAVAVCDAISLSLYKSTNKRAQHISDEKPLITNLTEAPKFFNFSDWLQPIHKKVSKPNNVRVWKHSVRTHAPISKSTRGKMPLCDKNPPDLGPIKVNKETIALREVEAKYPEVSWGGLYKPPNCTARHKVAIIIPYRDREEHLAIFLNHMHPFLMKQQLEYGIFVIEQLGQNPFNRAKLFNVGFKESNRLKLGGWQCFIFHDVDLLPMDTRNMYSCPRQPRHMSVSVDKFKFKLPYPEIIGGVFAMTYDQFMKVNGFSNQYWGWGAEDDDMWYRINISDYHVARYKMSIARYSMLRHAPASRNPKRYHLMVQAEKKYKADGLSSLQYECLGVERHHLYTLIKANIWHPSDSEGENMFYRFLDIFCDILGFPSWCRR